MFTILLKTLKGHRWPMLFTYTLVVGFGILIATSFEQFGREFAEEIPKGLSALLKVEGNLLLAKGAQGYIAIGFRHPLFLIIVSAFAIATASGALAREIEQRTILLLLARPIPRYHLVLGRGGESLLALILLVAAMLMGTFIGVALAGLTGSVDVGPFLVIGFNALCLAMVIMGYSYLFSALSSDGGRVTLLAAGLTMVFFLIDFISGLFEFLEPIGPASIFHYYDPVAIALVPGFPVLDVGLLLGLAAITFGAAVLVFQRRDIAV